MSVTLATILGTMAVQFGTAMANSKQNNKKADELADKQRAYEEKVMREGIEHSRAQYAEICALQRELEGSMHADRMSRLQNVHESILEDIARRQSLLAWPLLIPPYVLNGQALSPQNDDRQVRVAPTCILATSCDSRFNETIFPRLEERLACFCARHWNIGSPKSIRFLQRAWRDLSTDAESKINNLHAHLKAIPTLVISPKLRDTGLSIAFQWWGISTAQNGMLINGGKELPVELSIPVEPNQDYTKNSDSEISLIVDAATRQLEALISNFADLYYWHFYSYAPSLPALCLSLNWPKELCRSIGVRYLQILDGETAVPGGSTHTPEAMLAFLKSLKPILSDSNYQQQLRELYTSLCRRMGMTLFPVFDESLLTYRDSVSENHPAFMQNFSLEYNKKENTPMQIDTPINIDLSNMDSETYSKKRDELLSLIEKILKIEKLEKTDRNTFEQTSRKLQENQFNLVIIGEFQGGKSTLFNALCGGREISPRGALTKTSAICLTATNLADEKAPEYAKVTWKTDEELLLSMDRLLTDITPEDLGVTVEKGSAFNLSEHFKFNNEKHLALLNKTLQEREEKLNNKAKSPGGITKDEEEDLELLRIARIIAAFRNNEEVKKQRSKTRYEVPEVASLAVFPSEWDGRFRDDHPKPFADRFKPAEVLFAFIGRVDVYIHSKDLGRLGCTIIDCPGLFVSSWDTAVAISQLQQADAAIYLLGGEKEMQTDDLKAIKKIADSRSKGDDNFLRKIFFILNQKKADKVTSDIQKTDSDKLEGLKQLHGYDGLSTNIATVNNLLYFLGGFGDSLEQGTLDDVSRERFVELAKRMDEDTSDDPSAIWVDQVSGINKKLKKIVDLTPENVRACMEHSRAAEVFPSIEKRILSNRAHSILVDSGVNKVESSLKAIWYQFEEKEKNARKDLQQCELEYKAKVRALDDFEARLNTVLESTLSEYEINMIAERAYVNEVNSITKINNLSHKLALELCKTVGFSTKMQSLWKSACGIFENKSESAKKAAEKAKKEITDAISPAVIRIVEEELKGNLSSWVNGMYNGEHADYENLVAPRLQATSSKVQKEWRKTIDSLPSMNTLKVSPPDISQSLKGLTYEKINSADEIVDSFKEGAIQEIVVSVIKDLVAAITIAIIWIVADSAFTCGVGTIVTFILWLVSKERDYTKTKLYKKLNENLREKMSEQFEKEKDNLITELKKIPKTIAENLKKYYWAQFNNNRIQLENDINERRKAEKEARDKLSNIADEAKRVRIEQVEPLLSDINAFKNGLTKV